MRVQPFSVCSIVEKNYLISLECSDRILIPRSFQQALEYKQYDLLLLTDVRGKSIHGTLFGVHECDDLTLYVPTWLFHQLDVPSHITVSQAPKRVCRMIQVKPHLVAFSKRPDYIAKLNAALMNYGSLTQFTKIPLQVDSEIQYATIELIFPEKNKTCFIHNCGSIQLQTLPPLETEEAPPAYLLNTKEPLSRIPFTGRGFLLGPSNAALSDADAAAAAAAAARARWAAHRALNAKTSRTGGGS